MEPKLAHVKLSDIVVSDTNKMFRDDNEMTPEALKELIDSVKALGVIQPILLRPGKGKLFEVIAGERRFRAASAVELATIPANIRELTDEEAFEVQVTENLQRKDVHPLKEAFAYKFLTDKDPKHNTAQELALKFGKSEHYISTRLKLNDLIAEAKKDFQENRMSLGHALVIARLQPTDQKEIIKHASMSLQDGKQEIKYYQTIQELEEFIRDEIVCDLSAVAFDLNDATLVPKCGACSTCPKRSGANQLFADVKDKDRCFDRSCFKEKRKQFLITQIPTLIEKEPDLAFLASSSHWNAEKVDPQIDKVLKEHKVKVLHGNDFQTYKPYDKGHAKINGIYISGDDFGKRVSVWSTKRSAETTTESGSKKVVPHVDVKEAVSRINERLARSIELDQEKIYERILEALKAHPTQLEPNIKYYSVAEDAFLNYILLDKIGYDTDEVREKLKLPDSDDDDYPSKLFGALSKLDTSDRMYLMRKVMMHSYASPVATTNHAFFIHQIASSYKDIPIAQFEAEQMDIRKKREGNAEKRIASLKTPPKEKPAKPKVVGSTSVTPALPAPDLKKDKVVKVKKSPAARKPAKKAKAAAPAKKKKKKSSKS